ncbi:MAG: dienelactone hydrolase family protein [Planctomycetota bacterium]|jgi:dienelactone hydrolase
MNARNEESSPDALTPTGRYGPFLAAGPGIAPPSGNWRRPADPDRRRIEGRRHVLGRMGPIAVSTPAGQLLGRGEFEDLAVEHLRWRLPYGPPTDAVVLKPAATAGPLPGVVALHCHGGVKYFGRRKLARWREPHPLMAAHQEQYYGGRGWANTLARRGYVVMVHDGFAFGSRRVRLADVPAEMRDGLADPDDGDHNGIGAYNRWAAEHESLLAQTLMAAGTSWPAAMWAEDRIALDILAARDDVDPTRLGCAGLSGGGARTVYLAGLDERIAAAVCVGYMSTWRGYMLDRPRLRSWMALTPRLPAEMDFPEILALRAPAATMVLNCAEDALWSRQSMADAEAMLRDAFDNAGAGDRLCVDYCPGPHRFDAGMQDDAFDWLDTWLKNQ